MDLFYILLHIGGGKKKKKKPKVAVHIYADRVVRDKTGILIHCWCKRNLVYLFQSIFWFHVKKALLTQKLKVPLQPQLMTTIIEHLLCARHLVSALHV